MKELRQKKEKYRVAICGHFGGNKDFYDGQTIKTRTIADCLKKEFGAEYITCIDTYGGIIRAPFYLLQLVARLRNSENIIILPAQNGVKVLVPFLMIFNKFFHKKIHYVVIGGWLPALLEKYVGLIDIMQKIDYIYVETSTMRDQLKDKGFDNVLILPNFKDLEVCKENQLEYVHQEPYKICTFSRIMKNKGIEDIVAAVDLVNKTLKRCVYRIDVYGKIDEKYKDEFRLLQEQNRDFLCYKGIVAPNKSVTVLKNYFFLAFPTRFFTEGIPGTIIDAYAAGIPVVSAKWESFSDLIDEGLSGFGYSMGNDKELVSLLMKIEKNPECILNMKRYCLNKANLYIPEAALEILSEKL